MMVDYGVTFIAEKRYVTKCFDRARYCKIGPLMKRETESASGARFAPDRALQIQKRVQRGMLDNAGFRFGNSNQCPSDVRHLPQSEKEKIKVGILSSLKKHSGAAQSESMSISATRLGEKNHIAPERTATRRVNKSDDIATTSKSVQKRCSSRGKIGEARLQAGAVVTRRPPDTLASPFRQNKENLTSLRKVRNAKP